MATRIAVKLVTCLSSTALLFILTKPPHFHTLGRQTLQEPSRVRGGCSVPPKRPQCEEGAYVPRDPRGEPPTREGSTASPVAGPGPSVSAPPRSAASRSPCPAAMETREGGPKAARRPLIGCGTESNRRAGCCGGAKMAAR